MGNAERISQRNMESSSRRVDITDILLRHYIQTRPRPDTDDPAECRFQ